MSACSISSNLIKSLRTYLPYQEVYFHFFHEFSRNRDESSAEKNALESLMLSSSSSDTLFLKIRAVFHCWVFFQFKEDSRARIRRHCWSRWTSYRTTVPRMSFWITFVHVISLSSRSGYRSRFSKHGPRFQILNPIPYPETLKRSLQEEQSSILRSPKLSE